MFQPKIVFNDVKVIAAPGCTSWWSTHSECKVATGCITSQWTSIDPPPNLR